MIPCIKLKLVKQQSIDSPEEVVGERIIDWREALFKNSIEKSYLLRDANNNFLQKKVFVQLQWFPYINKDRMLKRTDV